MKKHINLSDAPLFFFNKNRMLKNGSFLRGFAKCFQSFKKSFFPSNLQVKKRASSLLPVNKTSPTLPFS